MQIVQARTEKGSITNCTYVIDGDNAYCYSYGELVAAVKDGLYVEYKGKPNKEGKDLYYSRTSNRHKKQFRKYMGIVA